MTEPAYDDLARELRAARPEASEELRERVRAIARSEPVRERRFRVAPLLVPALGAATVLAAVAVGIGTLGGGGAEQEAAEAPPADVAAGGAEARESTEDSAAAAQDLRSAAPMGETLPPSGNRLQEYRADLRVRVDDLDDLSARTAEAMRIARSLGGYVVSAQLTTPVGEDGDSSLVVRVPVTRVQTAIARFSELGVLVAQDVALQDLQAQANRQDDRIGALRRTIRTLELELQAAGLSAAERAELERRLANAERSLRQAQAAREATERRGRLARVGLTLTTREEGQVTVPTPPGEFEQTLRDALGALGQITAWTLAALIVASPFLALTVLLVLLESRRRRRADERLLQQA